MVSVTSSRAADLALARTDALVAAFAQCPEGVRPALAVFHIPDFAGEAWRRGKTAARRLESKTARLFVRTCSQLLRAGDAIAHDPGSDVFLAALLAPARDAQRARTAADCRTAVQRIAIAISLEIDLRVETGWSPIREPVTGTSLACEIERALERGARERERYEFFSAVGHELRTPLAGINGYLETLLTDERLDDSTARRFLETARSEALRLGRLIDGMFEFSLLDLSCVSTEGCTRVAPVLARASEIVAPNARSRGVRVDAECNAGASAAVEEDALLQLLINLLDNAIKHGAPDGCVRVRAAVEPGEIVVCVDDDGPGVQEASRETIFGLRARAGETQGSGIGLAIVKLIAERAGGRVHCTASPLGGARFEIGLPLGAESAVALS